MKHFEPSKLIVQMFEVIIGLMFFVALYPSLNDAINNFTGLGVWGGAIVTIVPIVIVLYFVWGIVKKAQSGKLS